MSRWSLAARAATHSGTTIGDKLISGDGGGPEAPPDGGSDGGSEYIETRRWLTGRAFPARPSTSAAQPRGTVEFRGVVIELPRTAGRSTGQMIIV